MTDWHGGNWRRSSGLWVAVVTIAVGLYLLSEGRLIRGPAVALAGVLAAILVRWPRRKYFLFAGVTVVLATLLPIGMVTSLDLYFHQRYASAGGYNVWGYRGRVVGRKQPGERRIAVLGGSTAFGYGVPADQTYPSYLERTLNELERRAGRGPVTVVNLAWNGEGAFSFLFTLEDYDYIEPDAVILYSGYNDLAFNNQAFRHQSAIFRTTGYMPILPAVPVREWLHLKDLSATQLGDKVVFNPHLMERSASQAADLARGISQALERQLEWLSSAQAESAAGTAASLDCGRWPNYCHWLFTAVRYALDRDRHVFVVTEPYLAGGGPAANAQFDQQSAVRGMLVERFAGESRVHYVNMGRAVDLRDLTLCYDGMHLTPSGNARLADRLAPEIQSILAEMPRMGGAPARLRVEAAPPLEMPGRIQPELLALGRYEQAREEAQKALLENPGDKARSDELASAELGLGRFAAARKVLEGEVTERVDDMWTHRTLYLIAAATDDRVSLERELAWAQMRPDRFQMQSAQADVAAASGRMRESRELARRAIKEAQQRGELEAAAVVAARHALAELLVGNTEAAVDGAHAALAMSRSRGPLWAAALVEALAGNAEEAAALSEEFSRASPSDLLGRKLWTPVLRAGIQLGRHDPEGALGALESTLVYERGAYWSWYLRGLAHLELGHAVEAVLELSRILAQPGVGPADPLYVVSERQFARARAASGNATSLADPYQKFFSSWKQADADVPLLQEARREYVELRRSISLPPLPRASR